MEIFIYAIDPKQVLYEFYCVLKPEGSVVLYEYNFKFSKAPKYLKDAMDKINIFASILANKKFEEEVLPRMLEDIGF